MRVEVYSMTGQLLNAEDIDGLGLLNFKDSGFFIVVIPEINYRMKVQLF